MPIDSADMIKDVLRNVDALMKTTQGSKPGTEIGGRVLTERKTTLRALMSKVPYIESYATLLIKECQVMLGFFLESEAGGGKRKYLFSHLSCSLY